MLKVYLANCDPEVVNFISDIEIVNKPAEAKLIVFGDGPQVSPSLYKDKKINSPEIKCNINRDRSDKAIYTKLRPDQITLGISRGACFLSVMNGAKIVQLCKRPTIKNFSYDVDLLLSDKHFNLPVISDWIQSINLNDCSNFKVLATSSTVEQYYDVDNQTLHFMLYNKDPEIVVFNRENFPVSICVQFHPEWMPKSYMSNLINKLIYKYVN